MKSGEGCDELAHVNSQSCLHHYRGPCGHHSATEPTPALVTSAIRELVHMTKGRRRTRRRTSPPGSQTRHDGSASRWPPDSSGGSSWPTTPGTAAQNVDMTTWHIVGWPEPSNPAALLLVCSRRARPRTDAIECEHQSRGHAQILFLGDVLPTGNHTPRLRGVKHRSTVVVVGDGPVLCAVTTARWLRAERISHARPR